MKLIVRPDGVGKDVVQGSGGGLFLGQDLGLIGMVYGFSLNGLLQDLYAQLCQALKDSEQVNIVNINEFKIERLAKNFSISDGERRLSAKDEIGSALFFVSRMVDNILKQVAIIGHTRESSVKTESSPRVYPVIPEGGANINQLEVVAKEIVETLKSALGYQKESAA